MFAKSVKKVKKEEPVGISYRPTATISEEDIIGEDTAPRGAFNATQSEFGLGICVD